MPCCAFLIGYAAVDARQSHPQTDGSSLWLDVDNLPGGPRMDHLQARILVARQRCRELIGDEAFEQAHSSLQVNAHALFILSMTALPLVNSLSCREYQACVKPVIRMATVHAFLQIYRRVA